MSGQARAERLRLLASIASELLAEQSESAVGDLCQRVRHHLGLDVLLYHVVQKAGDRTVLDLRASAGLSPEQVAGVQELELDSGICGSVAASGMPVVADLSHPSQPTLIGLARELGMTALACEPIIGPEGVFGTLAFGSRQRDRFQEDELWVMATVASLAALAVGRRQFARALRETENRLSLANLAAGQGLWEIDLETSHVTLSEKGLELFGVASDTALQDRSDWRQLVVEEDRAGLTAAIDKAQAGTDYQSEFRIRRPSDGQVRWIQARGRVLPGTRRLAGVLADVTDAKEAAEAQRRAFVESELALEALREKEEMLRLAILAGRGGMFVYQIDTGKLELSAEAAVLYGFPEDVGAVSKEQLAERLAPGESARMDQALRDAVSTEGVSKIDKHVRLPGGGTRTLAVYCQHQPERRRIVGLVVDVSERYAVEEALREEDRRKAEFIAILSHELRNPLAPIVYALPAIQRAPLGEDARRAADVIKRQMTHLARLVDDLLDISRINSGKVELRRETLELRPIVEAVVESMAPLFEAARHDVEVTLPEQPIWLEADPHRLAQILTNLLSNATRYTPRGGKIWLRATRERRRAVISVKDSGIGIAPDLMPRLFEMFQQIHRAEGLPQGGLGIGLALARRLATMHGGGIEAHSEGPGKGAEFIVTMPLARHRAAGEQHAAEAAVPAAARLKVLIVDDNADLVEMLATLIGSLGHNARKALDGPSALAAARAYGPDVVLLDLGLPMMSGLEVARALRTGAETRNAYLVALTGWGQDEDVRRTREAGFDRHLTKPTDPETLVALLSELAARRAAP